MTPENRTKYLKILITFASIIFLILFTILFIAVKKAIFKYSGSNIKFY